MFSENEIPTNSVDYHQVSEQHAHGIHHVCWFSDKPILSSNGSRELTLFGVLGLHMIMKHASGYSHFKIYDEYSIVNKRLNVYTFREWWGQFQPQITSKDPIDSIYKRYELYIYIYHFNWFSAEIPTQNQC